MTDAQGPQDLPMSARADVRAFVALLDRKARGPGAAEARALFSSCEAVVIARAPGRLDVMGGIADYSGSLVLELPTSESVLVAAALASDRQVRICSLGGGDDREQTFAMDLAQLAPDDAPLPYPEARVLFRRDPRQSWAGYVAGALVVLAREQGLRLRRGVRILLSSTVPEGKGLSSSAALEVATLQALVALFDLKISAPELARLAQVIENHVVGAPCGLMDQMTSMCGEEGRLLRMVCQPARLLPPVVVPKEIGFWGIDSGVRHQVGGADYGQVRVGAFMGYRMLAARMGFTVSSMGPGRVSIIDPRWGGYLANVDPTEWREQHAHHLPERMGGADYLAQWHGTSDPVTLVDSEVSYPVRAATEHPILENHRVHAFATILCETALGSKPLDAETRALLGELMYASHASYSACGLGSAATDHVVGLVRSLGATRGLWGAKITGGGSGGTVAVLGDADAGDAVAEVASDHARATGHRAQVFSGSSPGAQAFGWFHVGPA